MAASEERDLHPLEIEMGHRFRDPDLLRNALTHTSFWNEFPSQSHSDNQRLEFLGDAVLDLVVAELLFLGFPGMSEGEMTAARAALVREPSLASLAGSLHVGEHLLLGKGEDDSGGRNRAPNLCGALEALVGALYLDGGLDTVRAWLSPLFQRQLAETSGVRDPKSLLQEWAQARFHQTPFYRTAGETGPDHAKHFTVEAIIGETVWGTGSGSSKQAAAQSAASDALAHLHTEPHPAATDC